MERRVPNSGDDSGRTPRKRRPRLTLDQTRRGVLDAAARRVTEGGWASGLEHVRLEDAVRDADVSRTAAYRCWPRRDEFLADLLVDLAMQALPVEGDRGARATAVLREAVGADPNALRSPEGRRDALRRAVVASAVDDLAADRAESGRWRLYLGLATAVPAVPVEAGRARVAQAVKDAEDAVLDRLEGNYRQLLELFGCGPVGSCREVAAVGVVLMRGLVIGSFVAGAAGQDEAAAAAFGYLVDAAVVPTDTSVWDRTRAQALIDAFAATDVFRAGDPLD